MSSAGSSRYADRTRWATSTGSGRCSQPTAARMPGRPHSSNSASAATTRPSPSSATASRVSKLHRGHASRSAIATLHLAPQAQRRRVDPRALPARDEHAGQREGVMTAVGVTLTRRQWPSRRPRWRCCASLFRGLLATWRVSSTASPQRRHNPIRTNNLMERGFWELRRPHPADGRLRFRPGRR